MDNQKKTDSIMRYVVYLLCGVLTFSLTFGLVTAAHTDWEKKDG